MILYLCFSPNTPGLRSMQGAQQLESLLAAVIEERNKLERRVPLLVKVAPDLEDKDIADISRVIKMKKVSSTHFLYHMLIWQTHTSDSNPQICTFVERSQKCFCWLERLRFALTT